MAKQLLELASKFKLFPVVINIRDYKDQHTALEMIEWRMANGDDYLKPAAELLRSVAAFQY